MVVVIDSVDGAAAGGAGTGAGAGVGAGVGDAAGAAAGAVGCTAGDGSAATGPSCPRAKDANSNTERLQAGFFKGVSFFVN